MWILYAIFKLESWLVVRGMFELNDAVLDFHGMHKIQKTNTLQTRCLIALLFLYLAFYTNPLNTITAHCKSSVNDHDLNLKQ